MGPQNQVHGKELLKVQVQGQPKNLVVLRGSNGSTMLFDAHPLVEAFNAEHGTNLAVVSHKVADVACTVGDTWRSLPAFAVDASIAYEKPGTRLGSEIVFSVEGEPRVVLATGKFKGEKDVALVTLGVSAADFKKDGDSLVLDIPENRLVVVPDFPGPDGLYMPHSETGVPHGKKAEGNPDARYLYRLNDSSYLGLLVRGGNWGDSDGRDVGAIYQASDRFGVVAEVPEGDAAKIQTLIGVQTPMQTAAKTTVELPISATELKGLLGQFRQDLESLGSTAKDELLAAGRKLETLLSGANLKE
jgi:hypothetical protein